MSDGFGMKVATRCRRDGGGGALSVSGLVKVESMDWLCGRQRRQCQAEWG